MALPLHIFEERYKLLVEECIHNSRPFGVVLIRSGQETEPSATFHDVGTTAHITQVEQLHDGQMNIATLGYNRFRIRSTHNLKPYVTGIVDYFPLQGQENPRARVLAKQIGPMLQNYLNVFATLGKVESVEALPEDPMTLAFLTAIILRTPMKDKQILLNIPDLLTLLQYERKMLHREMHILNTLIEHGPRWRDDPKPFSTN